MQTNHKKKQILWTFFSLVLLTSFSVSSQTHFLSEGNGLFEAEDVTRVTIRGKTNTDNALLRLGNEGASKISLGYHASDDVWKVSNGTNLSNNGLTMGLSTFTNRFGVNSLPTTHRFQIRHNSTSGVGGSSHLHLLETGLGDYSRLRFGNEGDDGLWTLAARATDGDALFNIFYNDGVNFANIMSFDGDLFRVGIHETSPDAFLHIKQLTAGVDALKLVNDDQTGGETWGFRVGDNDVLIYFEGGLRASINSDDGVYTNFPPPPASSARSVGFLDEKVLEKVIEINPVAYRTKDEATRYRLDPYQISEISKDWVVPSEDGTKLGINQEQFLALFIQSIKEQQTMLTEHKKLIQEFQRENELLQAKVEALERRQLKTMDPMGEIK